MRDEFGVVIDNRERICLIGRTIYADYDGKRQVGRIVGLLRRGWYCIKFDDYAPFGRPFVAHLRRGEFILRKRV